MSGKYILLIAAILLAASLAAAGCTDALSEPDEPASPPKVVTIGNPQGTSAASTATATPTPASTSAPAPTPTAEPASTPIPTPTPRATPAATPTATGSATLYSAGDLLQEPRSGIGRLVTCVLADSEEYRVRLVFEDDEGERFLKKDASYQEMGEKVDCREFEAMKLVPSGTVESIPIYVGADDLYGFLEYESPDTMVFVRPSPEKLTGEVHFILELWYNGEVDLYSSIGNETTATTTHTVSEYRTFDLGESTRAYVRVYKDYSTRWMKAILTADGVTVDEEEAGSGVRSVTLSFST